MNRQRFFYPFLISIIVAGFAAAIFSVTRLSLHQLDWRFTLMMIVMAGLASRFSIPIPHVKGEVTVGDTLIFLTMMLYDGEAAILIAAADGLCSSLYVSKKPRVILFNSAQMACATFITVWTLRLCFGPILILSRLGYSSRTLAAVCLMALIQYASNSGLVATHTALKTNKPLFATWRNSYLWTSITYFAGASIASLAARLVGLLSIYAAIMVTPIIGVIYVTYKTYLKNIETSALQAEQAKRQAELLEESEERFRSAFDHASIGMALVSDNGRWLQVNSSLCEIVGYSEKELLATEIGDFAHVDDFVDVMLKQTRLVKGEIDSYQSEMRYVHKMGHEVWTLLSVSPVRDPQTRTLRFIFQVQDITSRKRAEAQLVHDAFHDALTGLPNRALFVDHLRLAVDRNVRNERPFSILFLDIDRFKFVNDSLGHVVGDQLLIGIARRLEGCLRPGDTIARLGGDEFTILLEDLTNNKEAVFAAERIERALAEPFDLEGKKVFITASVGIAHSGIGAGKPEDFLRDADTAMYCAKSLGSNQHQVFDKTMHARAVEMLELQNDLRLALERNELFLEYQPIVSLDTFRITGFEALIRWNHPRQGLIGAGKFIPVAEDTGLIVPIGEWVLRTACKQARKWEQLGLVDESFKMRVNLSAKQLNKPDLVPLVKRVLEETELQPCRLKLEITESVVVENQGEAAEKLKELRTLGVGLSIDDFGTGYSSLSTLHHFPMTNLKIDGSFVSRMDGDNESTEIVRTIMLLAGHLGMIVTAEGVETLKQVTLLRTLGCEEAQGFFFSRSLSDTAAEELLRETVRIVPGDDVMGSVESFMDVLVA